MWRPKVGHPCEHILLFFFSFFFPFQNGSTCMYNLSNQTNQSQESIKGLSNACLWGYSLIHTICNLNAQTYLYWHSSFNQFNTFLEVSIIAHLISVTKRLLSEPCQTIRVLTWSEIVSSNFLNLLKVFLTTTYQILVNATKFHVIYHAYTYINSYYILLYLYIFFDYSCRFKNLTHEIHLNECLIDICQTDPFTE